MVGEHRLSRSKACQIVGISRSAFYKPTVDWAAKDAPVIAALNDIVSQRCRWGFWKCFHRLRGDGHGWIYERQVPPKVSSKHRHERRRETSPA